MNQVGATSTSGARRQEPLIPSPAAAEGRFVQSLEQREGRFSFYLGFFHQVHNFNHGSDPREPWMGYLRPCCVGKRQFF